MLNFPFALLFSVEAHYLWKLYRGSLTFMILQVLVHLLFVQGMKSIAITFLCSCKIREKSVVITELHYSTKGGKILLAY